jgi:hypothetical protein
MYDLDETYLERLEELAGEIQGSDELNQYLEEEEEEMFMRLKEMFEPRIAMIYDEVAAKDPLQLIPLELVLLDEAFEGLFLPKILGYSVLRGEINEDYKYVRPQDHFKEVLLTICNSANFDILKKRIGQSIQIGFALSSDIWVTNLINSIENKRVRYYLQGQKLEKYRRLKNRKAGYERYQRQFKSDNYMTAEFPETTGELKTLFSPLKNFIIYRVKIDADNSSIIPPLKGFIENEDFKGSDEHLQIMGLYAFFFELEKENKKHLSKHLNETRKKYPGFDERFLEFVLELHDQEELDLTPQADLRFSNLLDKRIKDQLSEFYTLLDTVHTDGYTNDEVQDVIRVFYTKHEGLSTINECVRETIYQYFARYINNLEVDAYTDFFEITKLFPIYMGIFANQQFNQDLKELSMSYVRRLLKHYTDKRGKDYQDIKKFVSTTFQDFGFLKEKEVVELFKTRRKKRKKKPA